MTLTLVPLHPGDGTGRVHALTAPISFWGGTSLEGTIVDERHPEAGLNLSGGILVMTASRGSSSSSSILAEQIRLGTATAGIILATRDPIIILGAIAAMELYSRSLPIALADHKQLAEIRLLPRVHLHVTGSTATAEAVAEPIAEATGEPAAEPAAEPSEEHQG
ncbi:aconitase X swivel domain-containing protein [uncultured Amnibacterium sp.]|uniref:aconitase X swivel domain-containing protein n=1 Tax=uncultured Amnibacterium sp. TaxID=1631851 RepID=UPI0035C9E27F